MDWPGIRDRIFGRLDAISEGGRAYRDVNGVSNYDLIHDISRNRDGFRECSGFELRGGVERQQQERWTMSAQPGEVCLPVSD
mgnify:CR=1 FL=1